MPGMRGGAADPRVSVVIAAFQAHQTIERCLTALRAQTYRDFEVLLVDSSPGEETARIASRFPEVRLERSETRLYPHQARNRVTPDTRGALFVCLDADVYPRAEWLEGLVATFDARGGVIVGAIDCHGNGFRALGMHFCKFAKFLPAGPVRPIDTGPSANLLLAKADLLEVGGMKGRTYLADVLLGRALESIGRTLSFAPGAVVEHDHRQSVGAFLRERFERGKLYGAMRAGWLSSRRRIAIYFLASILPVRLVRIALLIGRDCAAARRLGALTLVWPLTLAGHVAWLAGESLAYAASLARPRVASDVAPGTARVPREESEKRRASRTNDALRPPVEHPQQRP